METRHHSPILKVPLAAAITFVAATLIAVSAARLSGFSPEQSLGSSDVIASRTLTFEDTADGNVRILDAETGDVIALAGPGTNGFLRGALRGLMRVRKREDVSYHEPFRLERRSNGQLILIDLGEGRSIDLNAYGQTNAAVFDAFLARTGEQG